MSALRGEEKLHSRIYHFITPVKYCHMFRRQNGRQHLIKKEGRGGYCKKGSCKMLGGSWKAQVFHSDYTIFCPEMKQIGPVLMFWFCLYSFLLKKMYVTRQFYLWVGTFMSFSSQRNASLFLSARRWCVERKFEKFWVLCVSWHLDTAIIQLACRETHSNDDIFYSQMKQIGPCADVLVLFIYIFCSIIFLTAQF